MKSFLGVANYFRDHIRDYATIVHPLQEMIRNYDRSRLLRWSPAANKAWDDIRAAINDCPKLFFLNPQAPVFLHTDASAYGIGAYLFQIVDGVHQPIAFISKALSSQQRLKWTVPEKEAYAIYYSFQKLEYLIRDAILINFYQNHCHCILVIYILMKLLFAMKMVMILIQF